MIINRGSVPENIYRRKLAVTVVTAFLLVILYLIIWGFSAQDADASGSLSHMITEKVIELIDDIASKNWSDIVKAELAEYFEHPVRKLAHFSEYACMGLLVYIMLGQWVENRRRLYIITILWVFVSAAIDEFHQTFIPGRYGSFADVILDTSGAVVMLIICRFIRSCSLRRSRSL